MMKQKIHNRNPIDLGRSLNTVSRNKTGTVNSFNAPNSDINFSIQKKVDESVITEQTPASSITQLYAEVINPFSFQTNSTQLKSYSSPNNGINFIIQRKTNTTGLPENLKSGIENLSGYSLDDVKVHYNSSKPAQLSAHAYAQGNQIHIAPGQQKHLAHETWHVVQQKQGRVKPTKQLKSSVAINDNPALEKEADIMGNKALQLHSVSINSLKTQNDTNIVTQLMFRIKTGKTTDANPHNEGILRDALEALLEVQNHTVATVGSFAEQVSNLADYIGAKGYDAKAQADLRALYESMAELSFKSNPVLNEAWSRCIASTRSAAAKSIYSKVGGKFNKKFEEVLEEIRTGYPGLDPLVYKIMTANVNKEHLINKGLGGLQTAHKNLMDAGVGDVNMGGTSTLSELHKELHRLKSGGLIYDYNTMDAGIRADIKDVQDGYDSDDMGALQHS
ncbi:MAG: DUF4157 domain-containing protein [Bacteroidota bacterium]